MTEEQEIWVTCYWYESDYKLMKAFDDKGDAILHMEEEAKNFDGDYERKDENRIKIGSAEYIEVKPVGLEYRGLYKKYNKGHNPKE